MTVLPRDAAARPVLGAKSTNYYPNPRHASSLFVPSFVRPSEHVRYHTCAYTCTRLAPASGPKVNNRRSGTTI